MAIKMALAMQMLTLTRCTSIPHRRILTLTLATVWDVLAQLGLANKHASTSTPRSGGMPD